MSKLHWILISLIMMIFAAGCGQLSGRYADKPEDALLLYLQAKDDYNVKALKKVWWVSNDAAQVDEIIAAEMASSRAISEFHDRLREEYGEELQRLVDEGKLQMRDKKERPSDDAIREAVAAEFHSGNNSASVYVEDLGIYTITRHDQHWYVDGDFIRVGRDWI